MIVRRTWLLTGRRPRLTGRRACLGAALYGRLADRALYRAILRRDLDCLVVEIPRSQEASEEPSPMASRVLARKTFRPNLRSSGSEVVASTCRRTWAGKRPKR